MPHTVHSLLYSTIKKLEAVKIPSAHLDAEILLSSALGKPKIFLYTHPEYVCNATDVHAVETLLLRRLQKEPIAYIIKEKEFYGRSFFVDKRVLIPRPKTEEIVDKVLHFIASNNVTPPCALIDIGTGSGCIIITLAKELLPLVQKNHIRVFASDISKDALDVAKHNAAVHSVKKYISFLHGDLLLPFLSLPFTACRSFIVTANLPYIPPDIYDTLEPEITTFEPKGALIAPHPNCYYDALLQQIDDLKAMTHCSVATFFEHYAG